MPNLPIRLILALVVLCTAQAASGASGDPLPLGCGIPTDHSNNKPHLQHDGKQCHGTEGDSGTCRTPNGGKVTCVEDPRDPTKGTCTASLPCQGITFKCASNAKDAWAGKTIVDGVERDFLQCEYDNGNPPSTLLC